VAVEINGESPMLEGKFFIQDSHEYYRTGQIREKVDESGYLVVFDIMKPDDPDRPPLWPQQIVTLTELTEKCPECGEHRWQLFDTAEDRQRWLEWVDRPPPSKTKKVVKLVTKTRR
jgi:hypothetical protein